MRSLNEKFKNFLHKIYETPQIQQVKTRANKSLIKKLFPPIYHIFQTRKTMHLISHERKKPKNTKIKIFLPSASINQYINSPLNLR